MAARKCPSCGFVNVEGFDRCEACLHSLMHTDLPRPQKNDTVSQAIMNTPVSALLTGKDLLVASPTDSMLKVIQTLDREAKNCILVYEQHKLVGIISCRDILRKVAGKYEDLNDITVGELMTPNPESVRADAPLAYVVNVMGMGGFRHVPVLTADGAPLSIITIKDVLKYLSQCEASK